MGYRIKAGLRRFTRRVVLAVERLVGRPISKTTRYELMMSATSRSSFAWAPAKKEEVVKEHDLFVRVEPDIPVIEEEIEAPVKEKVYSTPSYTTITPTSSEAVMYEFSGRYDFDQFGMGDVGAIESQAQVYEAPAIRDYYETEEERQFYEELYEDLTVEAVLDYMDTIELYAAPKEYVETEGEKQFFEGLYEYLAVDAVLSYMETIELYASPAVETEETVEEQVMALEAPSVAGYISAPVSEIAGYLSAPVAAISDEPEEFYEDLYEDLAVEAVLDYMDTIELYASPAAVEDEPEEFYEGLYEDLTVEVVLDYMDTIELYAAPKTEAVQSVEPVMISAPAVAGYIEAPAAVEDEPEEFYESVYEDLAVEAVLDCMDTIELYASERPAPEYVISEIEMPQEEETKIVIEPARPTQVKQNILAQFVFGFDAPVNAKAGTTKFRFIAGEEEEPEEDIEDVQVMTYNGDAAVAAQSVSNGSLAL